MNVYTKINILPEWIEQQINERLIATVCYVDIYKNRHASSDVDPAYKGTPTTGGGKGRAKLYFEVASRLKVLYDAWQITNKLSRELIFFLWESFKN